MAKNIRVIGLKRKAIDDEKLALAFLLLAKTLHDQGEAADDEQSTTISADGEQEAA